MADLQTGTFTLLSWFLYVGIALCAGAVIASTIFFYFGNRATARKFFVSGLAGLLLGASASQIFGALVSGLDAGSVSGVIAYAIVACLLVCSVIFFGLGRREEGVNYAVAAVLAAGFVALIPAVQALFSSETVSLAGTCMFDADVDPVNPRAGEAVNLTVTMTYGSGSYTLHVSYGDGSSATSSISPGSSATLTHVYRESGVYSILLTAKGNGSCYYALGVNVGEPPSPWFLGPFDMSGFFESVNSVLKIPLNFFYWTPEFDLSRDSEDMKLYFAVTSVAITALGLFVALRIVSGFLEKDPSTSVVDSIREAIIVIAVILAAPYLYQTFAVLCNQVSSIVVDRINVGASLGGLVAVLVASAVLGVVSSFAGTFGGTLLVAFMLSSFTAILRYALIKAIVYCIPLLAVAYLFPATRGAVKFFMNVLAGLVLAGPVAAFILAGMSGIGGAVGYIGAVAAPAITFFAFPIMLAMASGASPGAAASGLLRLTSGAMAGFRGPTVEGAAQPENGTSGGSEATTTQVTGYRFTTYEDYARALAGRNSNSGRDSITVSRASPPTAARPAMSTPRVAASSAPAADTGGGEAASRPSRSVLHPVEAYSRLKDWYERSVFKQKIYPKWSAFMERYGGWGGYGHHVVLGSVHPYSYKSLRDETRAFRRTRSATLVQDKSIDEALDDFLGPGAAM